MGKTALAVYWAHQIAGRFPDGQLYVNLRGFDPGQPMTAADALAGFLHALGVPGQDIPVDEQERAARYRSLLAGRRMLIVADNAGDVEQVRPLLPGTPTCAVLVTSRDALAGLVARDGARRLDLDLLTPADAVALLRALIGQRVDTDPDAAVALASHCARLPLALRVAAELAADRLTIPLSELVDELADQQGRLDLLDAGGDPRTAVRAVFSWSYRHLGADTARAFRLAGLHPGPDLDLYATAALADVPIDHARRMLQQLTRAHLLQATGAGRFGLHDLLRDYARELADRHDSQDDRRAALTRLFDHYLHTAAKAMDTLYPAEADRRPGVPAPHTVTPPVADAAAARAWLGAERGSLIAVAVNTATDDWPGYATRLAAILFRYLDAGAYFADAFTVHSCARRAARQAGDRAAEAAALTNLGVAGMQLGQYHEAADQLSQAGILFRQVGDRVGEARALGNLGTVSFHTYLDRQAVSQFQQALALYGEIGDRVGEGRQLHNLGAVHERLGRWSQAAEYYQRALALCFQIGDMAGVGYALNGLGVIDLQQARYADAASHLGQALAEFQQSGDRAAEADALINLGLVRLKLADHQQAADQIRRALALTRETDDRRGEAKALNRLGEVLLAADQSGEARAQHVSALDLAGQIDDKYEHARALHGLGHAYYAAADPERARDHWQQALDLYVSLEASEADQVRTQLDWSASPRSANAVP